MLFKLPILLRNFILLLALACLSALITDLFAEFSSPDVFEYNYETLKTIVIVLLYSVIHIIFLSKEKFKDFALLLIFIGLGGSSRVFYIYFIHVFHKTFFIGVILLIFYILYEVKQDYNSNSKKNKK